MLHFPVVIRGRFPALGTCLRRSTHSYPLTLQTFGTLPSMMIPLFSAHTFNPDLQRHSAFGACFQALFVVFPLLLNSLSSRQLKYLHFFLNFRLLKMLSIKPDLSFWRQEHFAQPKLFAQN